MGPMDAGFGFVAGWVRGPVGSWFHGFVVRWVLWVLKSGPKGPL